MVRKPLSKSTNIHLILDNYPNCYILGYMIKHYTLENKPRFEMGEAISVDMATMGMPEYGILIGCVVGKTTTHILDQWMVDFGMKFPSYPYHVVSIIHTAIVDEK